MLFFGGLEGLLRKPGSSLRSSKKAIIILEMFYCKFYLFQDSEEDL
jgi:hypothetical protein